MSHSPRKRTFTTGPHDADRRLTPEGLQSRLDRFASAAGDVVPDSEHSFKQIHRGRQLVRSSSAAAACYAEGCASPTSREFLYKLHTCLRELRESMSWLNQLSQPSRAPLTELRSECDELIAILYSSIRTMKKDDDPPSTTQ
jgi:four helix bundle protein